MNCTLQVQLKLESILNIFFDSYPKDFTFLVNGKEFKTYRMIADLLSPVISKLHLIDPTVNIFTIETQQKGDFSTFLNLFDFKQKDISETEALFISEIIEILGSESIDINEPLDNSKITNNNIFHRIFFHSKISKVYSKSYKIDVDYLSSHFFELCESRIDDLKKLPISSLEHIINNPKLTINSEDQLVNFINYLYKSNSNFSILYEHVNFNCVSQKSITDFLNVFNINDITQEMWKKLSLRLQNNTISSNQRNNRCCQKVYFEHEENKEFNGIINYLRTLSKDEIFDTIEISSSSILENRRLPQNVIAYNDKNKDFSSKNEGNSWLAFDFKDYQVIPTDYTIQSYARGSNGYAHPKSWVIEGSNNNKNWEILNEQKNSSVLNGESIIHTFQIGKKQQKTFRYLRMRITGVNWGEIETLCISSIEFYGSLIPIK